MLNPWLNEHKSTSTMNYFLNDRQKKKNKNNDLQNTIQKTND